MPSERQACRFSTQLTTGTCFDTCLISFLYMLRSWRGYDNRLGNQHNFFSLKKSVRADAPSFLRMHGKYFQEAVFQEEVRNQFSALSFTFLPKSYSFAILLYCSQHNPVWQTQRCVVLHTGQLLDDCCLSAPMSLFPYPWYLPYLLGLKGNSSL